MKKILTVVIFFGMFLQHANAIIIFSGPNVQTNSNPPVELQQAILKIDKIISPTLKNQVINRLSSMSTEKRAIFVKNVSGKIDLLLKNSKLSQKNKDLLKSLQVLLFVENLRLNWQTVEQYLTK